MFIKHWYYRAYIALVERSIRSWSRVKTIPKSDTANVIDGEQLERKALLKKLKAKL